MKEIVLQKKKKNYFKRFVLLFTFLLSAYHPFAHSNEVSGIITKSSGQPLPEVNIVVKGSTTGAQSDPGEEYRNVLSTLFDNHAMLEEKGEYLSLNLPSSAVRMPLR